MAARGTTRWTALPAELLQHAFSFLEERQDRLRVLGVCPSWAAALAAAPALLPKVVLKGQLASMLRLDAPYTEYSTATGPYVPSSWWQLLGEIYQEDRDAASAVLVEAAGLPDFLPAVELRGFDEQPELVPAVLAILPERISKIELATDATDPVLTVLSRFKRLCTLNISGNGAFLDWQARGAAAVVPKLKMLRLDCRDLEQLYKYADGLQSPKEHIIPDSDNPPCRLDSIIPNALAAATALSSLELVLDWTEDVAALCRGLPALRNLSLEVTRVRQGHMEAAVGMLQALTCVTALKLGFSAWPEWHGGYHLWNFYHLTLGVPHLQGLAQLTELRLNAVGLPPDWRQLINLQRLSWNDLYHTETAFTEGTWKYELPPSGLLGGPLTALTALTELELHTPQEIDVELVATLPRLSTLHVPKNSFKPDAFQPWVSAMRTRRPGIEISE